MMRSGWIGMLVSAAAVVAAGIGNAGDLGLASVTGSYADPTGQPVAFRGVLTVVDVQSGRLMPTASQPQPDRCPSIAAPMALEATAEWAWRAGVILAISTVFQVPKSIYREGCEMPALPFKSGGVSLNAPAGVRAPVLGLARGREPYIGYAREASRAYDVVLSGNSFRQSRQIVAKSLLLEGGVYHDPTQPFPLAPHPRLAVGKRQRGGELIVLYIEGRTPKSQGVSLPILADLLRACGVSDAINFDGGGSAQLIYSPAPKALRAIDITTLCHPVDDQRMHMEWRPLALTQGFASAPLDKCNPAEAGCRDGVRYRPLPISLGFTASR